MPLRLFANGQVDFGWPLLSQPHRPIDRLFHQLRAGDGLHYIQCLLAALATDAAAPPEIIEHQARGSVPKAMRQAIRDGVRPMDVMRTIIIPRRIELVRSAPGEAKGGSGASGIKQRWHIARAYARTLPEGYHRSDDNLNSYLDDLARGAIYPLDEADDQAIRNGTKCYVHPTERGDAPLGRIVSNRAKIGPGATRRILDGEIQGEDHPSV